MGILVRMGYGLSETGGVTGQAADTWGELEPLLGSTGSVFGGTEIKIRSIEDGKSKRPARECRSSRSTLISFMSQL